MGYTRTTENLAYHAGRLLLLISLCGKPRRVKPEILPAIEGRTLLAKLDFFLRYPSYLRSAAKILKRELSNEDLGLVIDAEEYSIESHMVRFLYGPWDHVYYSALAYLVGKKLIEVENKGGRGTEIFRLTEKGREIADEIAQDPAYVDLSRRANAVYHIFNKYTGNALKDFIHANFPEIVGRKIGTII